MRTRILPVLFLYGHLPTSLLRLISEKAVKKPIRYIKQFVGHQCNCLFRLGGVEGDHLMDHLM